MANQLVLRAGQHLRAARAEVDEMWEMLDTDDIDQKDVLLLLQGDIDDALFHLERVKG